MLSKGENSVNQPEEDPIVKNKTKSKKKGSKKVKTDVDTKKKRN
jgi:hypothetical protein